MPAELAQRRAELAQRIEDTFATVPYPGDDNIGSYGTEDFVGQKDWRKVPLKLLLHNVSEISALSDEAFRFYMPAYLCAVLRDPAADGIVESLVSYLAPSPIPDRTYIADHAIKLFTRAEKAVILEFLERHGELFPETNCVIMDDYIATLQRAIHFWQKNL